MAVLAVIPLLSGCSAASTPSSSPKAHAATAVTGTTTPGTTTIPAAATTIPTAANATIPTPVDLRTIDWGDVSVPGRACGPDITANITLHNGQATVQDPTVHSTVTTPGVPQLSGEYPLNISIQPQSGQLAGGPQIAVLALTCSLSGVAAGLYETTAVFDAPTGTPQLLALLSDDEYGHIPGVDSALVPTAFHVSNGVITVYGSYLQADDPVANPTGRGSTTVIYRDGTIAPSGIIAVLPSGPALSPTTTVPTYATTPPTSGTGGGQTITAQDHSGRTYTAAVAAQDQVADCAANSYGTALIDYFEQHLCPAGASRRLETIPYQGRTVALSIIEVEATAGPPGDLYEYATQLDQLENAPNTGGLDDLLRSGVRPAGWPLAIPGDETFLVMGEDTSVYIFDAWYFQGPTVPQDPTLVNLIHDIFLTPLATPDQG